MKAGWQTKKLGAVATLQRGFDLPTQHRVSGSIPLVSSSGVIDTHHKSAVGGPGVATGRSGSIGNVFFIEQDFWPLNTVLYVKDFHGNDPRFVFHLLKHFDLKRFASGTGVPTLNRNFVHDELVHVPPLPEQHRLVTLLDQAFDAIATAQANTEKNLQNAHALFESHLQSVFSNTKGWEPKNLADIAKVFGRGKSRHRPRNEPKLYGGNYPFIQTGDVRNAAEIVDSYSQTYSEMGLAQSKLWPAGTVCITIAANIAETAILGFDACIPDSIIGLVTDEAKADNKFVLYLLRSFKAHLQAQGKGSAQNNINMGTFETQSFPFPSLNIQRKIVAQFDALSAKTQRLASLYQKKLTALDALKKSLLHQAFSGQLTADQPIEADLPPAPFLFPTALAGISTTDAHAGILAMAFALHESNHKLDEFTHVKAEKIAHMVEARVGIDLGRSPVKDAAGPNDFNHLKKVEHRARMANYFDFKQTSGGAYRVQKLGGFQRLVDKTIAALGNKRDEVEKLLAWMLPMNVRQAEIVATVYAAWNNLLMDGKKPTDEEIVHEARENWHPDKLKIERERFFKAVEWLQKQGVIPEGRGKRVMRKGS